MIRIHKVSKSFGEDHATVRVLDAVEGVIKPGTLNIFLGRSGSGKSTLLNILAGLEKPDQGFVEILGQNITNLDTEAMARFRLDHMGLVFQFFNLLPTLSLAENVALAGHLKKMPRGELKERVQGALESVSLTGQAGRLPHQASGGEIQRAAIARALINSPDIILADEPTGNLDEKNGADVAGIFKDLVQRAGKTVLIVTHDSSFEKHADHVFRLENGRLVS